VTTAAIGPCLLIASAIRISTEKIAEQIRHVRP